MGCLEEPDCVSSCAAAVLPKIVAPEDVLGALGLLLLSGLFSGLTLGLMSLDIRQLELAIAGGDRVKKRQAEKILPLRQNGNLLLCTLLLGNTLVNSGIAILTASFTGGVIGGVVSTASILIFGEIIPQSVCSRYGLAAGAKTVDIVRVVQLCLLPIAYPLSKVLDHALGAELGTIYSRTELKELFAMQAAKRANEGGQTTSDGRGTISGTRDGAGLEDGIRLTEATFMCGVLSLSERSAEQIMTKMSDVYAIFTDERLDFPLMSRIYKSGFTRIPVLRRPKPQVVPPKMSMHHRSASDPQIALRSAAAAAEKDADLTEQLQPVPTPREERMSDRNASSSTLSADEWAADPAGTANAPNAAAAAALSGAGAGVEMVTIGGESYHVAFADEPSHLGDGPDVVGLLSAKDLILIDPEDALNVETLLAHCGRDVMRVWNDTPVNQLFKDFTRGSSHLAFVQRRSTPPERSAADVDADHESEMAEYGSEAAFSRAESTIGVIGIVTLEDVLEELIQAEIVDESDVVVDNVSRRRVDEDIAAQQRRLAFNTMLDPRELYDQHLDAIEIAAVASFLAANVECFSPLLISAATLQQLLGQSVVRVANGSETPPFEKGKACDGCTVVLQGRLHVVCGSEEFESDRGPWTVLGAPSLRQNPYVSDFTAKVMEPSRLLEISRADYEYALKREAESLAAAVRAAVYEQARLPQVNALDTDYGAATQRSPVARVACTLAPELAHQYAELTTVGVARACSNPEGGLRCSFAGAGAMCGSAAGPADEYGHNPGAPRASLSSIESSPPMGVAPGLAHLPAGLSRATSLPSPGEPSNMPAAYLTAARAAQSLAMRGQASGDREHSGSKRWSRLADSDMS